MTSPYRKKTYDFSDLPEHKRIDLLRAEVESDVDNRERARALVEQIPPSALNLDDWMLDYARLKDYRAAEKIFTLDENRWDRKELMRKAPNFGYNALAWMGRKCRPKLYHPALLPLSLTTGMILEPARRIGKNGRNWLAEHILEQTERHWRGDMGLEEASAAGNLQVGSGIVIVVAAVAAGTAAQNFGSSIGMAGTGLEAATLTSFGSSLALGAAASIAFGSIFHFAAAVACTALSLVVSPLVGLKKAAGAACGYVAKQLLQPAPPAALPPGEDSAPPPPREQPTTKFRIAPGAATKTFTTVKSRVETVEKEAEAPEPATTRPALPGRGRGT